MLVTELLSKSAMAKPLSASTAQIADKINGVPAKGITAAFGFTGQSACLAGRTNKLGQFPGHLEGCFLELSGYATVLTDVRFRG
jgi:hypothetical protein